MINKGKIFDKMIILFLFVFFINISCVSATNFTVDEIGNASTSVQTYVEANHKLPNNVTISGTTVTMPQFLKLETTATYNIQNNITTDITLENYNTALNPSETATNGQLTQSNYITLANNVKSFMNENGRAPNFQTTSLGNIRYESLVYTFSQVMNSYRVGKVLPDFIIIRPWTFVTNNTTKFITMNQINVAADTVQSYIDYIITADLTHNNQGNDTSSDGNIPDNIPVNFSSTFGTINNSGSTKKGRVELKLNGTATGTANVSAALDNQTVSKSVSITSVNVLGVYNTRTQESFATIQEAVDDPDTKDGDIITLAEGIYTENVAINKKLSIQPVTGANVTVEADNSDKSVFVMNNEGSGTTIKNLNIESSADSYGISLSHSYNVNIINNIITNSSKGIYLYKSGNNIITGNTVKNSRYGIFLYNSNCNSILGGNIKINENGLYLFNSDNNQINGTTITENYYGTYLFYSNNNDIIGNVISDNWVGTYLYDTNSNSITGNSLSDNGVGITHYNSIGIILSGNNFTDNLLADSSTIDSGEMVLATTIYSCGAAALATILKSFGIYATENELATLAGTDETGASFYGLKTAAQSMGVSAIGARLTVDQLKTNYLVVLDIDGKKHFEIIKNITTTTVYLFDPNLGNIEMPLDKFNEMYTGVALVLNDTLPPGTVLLTDDEMRDIKALGYWTKDAHYFTIPGFYYPTIEWRSFSYPVPVLKWKWVPPYKLFGIIPIPGHTEPYITLEWRTGSYPVVVWRYRPPQRFVYYTPRWVKEEGEVWNDNVYIKVFKGAIAISTGTTMIRGGIGLIGITEGWGTPAGIILIGMGAGVTWYGVEQVIDGLDDPWSVKPNRFLYD